jgi:type VI secretion system protein
MREARLLERIRLREGNPQRREVEDTGRVIDSVLDHLTRILNTRRGNVPIAEDYGIPDYTEFLQNFPESLRDLETAIEQTVTQYEPRLKTVRVSFVPQDENVFAVKFQISARLVSMANNTSVLFESQLDTGGKISIKR